MGLNNIRGIVICVEDGGREGWGGGGWFDLKL